MQPKKNNSLINQNTKEKRYKIINNRKYHRTYLTIHQTIHYWLEPQHVAGLKTARPHRETRKLPIISHISLFPV